MINLTRGDSGPSVTLLQERLTRLGYRTKTDGQFGPETLQQLIRFQRHAGLVVDGIAGAKTQAALLKKDTTHLLGQSDLDQAADHLQVDIASLHAIIKVETRGHGFLEHGLPVALFERHIMAKRLSTNGFSREEINRWIEKCPDLVNTKPGGYRGGSAELYRIKMASTISTPSALESASWGLFQIMGYHWKRLGYESITSFVSRMMHSEGEQLHAFVLFIQADPDLHRSLQQKDWTKFARRYNGPGFAKNQYDKRLAAAHQFYTEYLENIA